MMTDKTGLGPNRTGFGLGNDERRNLTEPDETHGEKINNMETES